jgi:hypothetical protein
MRLSPQSTLLLLAALTTAVGCTKLKRGKDDGAELPAKPVDTNPIEAQKSTLGILVITTELRSDGLMLRVANVPEGATLECDLDSKPLVPCHDGALFARPADGEHKISAVALKSGAPAAFGESAPFTILPGATGSEDEDPKTSLRLVVDDAAYRDAMPVPMAQDFVARFKLAGTPECASGPVQVKCKYDSRTSQFWTQCDAPLAGTSGSYTVAKALLALGEQVLQVQAGCGDRLGPVLTMSWSGVPDGYEPLMLKDVKDQSGRHLVELIRDADCPEGQPRKFECRFPSAQGAGEFEQCQDSNSFANPPAGSKVRFRCADQTGPELAL